ncbi:liprin-beta-1-like isoform X4 [Uloborus diversus]|uniref:liprin-beta-1-like isoform X4 n=1 Tax=Uloborus diversus TaxID=327109 RepID=UPI002408F7D6|nr:liprin-beta-1-like isoform X4 [Uloborus diversus]
MDISRALDNGNIRCDRRWDREKDDSGMHKFRDSESLRCYADTARQVDCSNESDMSEAIFAPIRPMANDGSDFSDTSISIPCSPPVQYCAKYPTVNGSCRECHSPSVSNCVNKRRRRKVMTRSLVLEPGFDSFPQVLKNRSSSGLSDSGVHLRGDRQYQHDSDSSSSSSTNVSALKVVRRKPKPQKRFTPPTHHYVTYQNASPRPIYSASLPPYSWIPVHSDDISNIQKVQTLESEKKNLILQASVLADQVEAQADKINELERIVQLKKEEFIRMEQNLHQEMMTRSSLENNKLELMTELSNLRLRLTAAERDRKESDDKCRKFESELILLQARLYEQEAEHAALKGKLSRNINLLSSSELSEIDRLKSALDSVMNSNDEKDQKIEDLRTSLNNYKKLQDIVLSSHVRKVSDSSTRDAPTFDTDSHVSSIGSTTSDIFKVPATIASMSSVPSQFDQSLQSQNSSTVDKTFSNHCSSSTFHKSNSVENICLSSGMVMPAKTQYGTVPRQTGTNILQQLQSRLQEPGADNRSLSSTTDEKPEASIADSVNKTLGKNSRTLGGTGHKSSGVSFGKGFFKLKSGKRSSSEPQLAQECITIPSGNKENFDFVSPLNSQPYLIKNENRNKGFLKFFSKWKRSGSQNIDKVEDNFRRGGIRATAGPRLGWSRDIQVDPDIPFCKWSTEMISEWFCKLGLNSYVNDCKRWMCNGEILSKATPQDLEKELNIKNHLHKKKLLLAIKSMTSSLPNLPSSINMLDYHWVVRWLDDVGLPQYKDSFAEARVDGRVLHCLTVEDLLFLKVSSQLHHTSIKRGIQVLREKSFDPHCLVRRSLPDEIKPYSPDVVALWSNHRVMEWLRTVDLSEYAPNLRGSGVHGALIIHEPRFNSNLLATLLNIPPNKTLLRRHLATHFKHIVGDPLMQVKREKETETPLSPSVKVKIVRKPQFALKKKRNKSELDNEEYICPMDIPVSNESAKYPEGDKLVVRRNSDPSPQDQRHMDLKEETVERIGAVSKDISNLTSMLQSDQLSEAQTTVV